MTISEQIKVLCVRCNISVAELARRMGTTLFCPSRWRKDLMGDIHEFIAL